MSIISFIEGLFGGELTAITVALGTAEQATVAGLAAFSALVGVGATVTPEVASELETLLPSLKTAISNSANKVEGWENELKTALADAETFLAARTVATTAPTTDTAFGAAPAVEPSHIVIS